jgi:hypothetical protein
MSLQILRFLAMIIGPSITAAARPAATFLGIQILVAFLISHDLATLPEAMQWIVETPAIGTGMALAILENIAKHDMGLAAILRDSRVDNIFSAMGAAAAALLFIALGMPESEAIALVEGSVDPTGSGGLLDATAGAMTGEHSLALQAGAIGGGLGINLGLTRLRSQLLEFVEEFEIGQIWARIETGGVIGVMILLPLLPLVVFTFLVAFTLVFVALAFAVRTAQRVADQRARVACETCDYQVRVEASLCPECRTEREPTGEHRSGLGAALDALRRRSVDDGEVAPST